MELNQGKSLPFIWTRFITKVKDDQHYHQYVLTHSVPVSPVEWEAVYRACENYHH